MCVCMLCICCYEFLLLNQLDALISQIYFWNKTLHVSDSSSVHHQEVSLYTQQGICHTVLLTASCQLSANLFDIYHCRVYSENPLMMARGTVRNM